jgi:hypothetical protein
MVKCSDNVAYLRVTGGRIMHAWIPDLRPHKATGRVGVMYGIACCEPNTVVFQHNFSQRYGYMLYEDFEIYSSCKHRANIVQMRAAAQQYSQYIRRRLYFLINFRVNVP